MNIIMCDEGKICIELTGDDMNELDITFEELDYSQTETKRVLWTVLDMAGEKLGKKLSISEKMLIEAFPSENGGCMLYVTTGYEGKASRGRSMLLKKRSLKIVCSTNKIDSFAKLSCVPDLHPVTSELFTDGKSYRLILTCEEKNYEKTQNTVCEFCDICNPLTQAHTYESWQLLCSPDALGMLKKLS